MFKAVARDAADNVASAVSDSMSRITDVAAAPAADARITARLVLHSVRPNPASDRLSVDFSLREAAAVTISLYDVSGRRVAVLARGRRPAGRSVVDLRPNRSAGAFGPGILFLRIDAGGETVSARIATVR